MMTGDPIILYFISFTCYPVLHYAPLAKCLGITGKQVGCIGGAAVPRQSLTMWVLALPRILQDDPFKVRGRTTAEVLALVLSLQTVHKIASSLPEIQSDSILGDGRVIMIRTEGHIWKVDKPRTSPVTPRLALAASSDYLGHGEVHEASLRLTRSGSARKVDPHYRTLPRLLILCIQSFRSLYQESAVAGKPKSYQ